VKDERKNFSTFFLGFTVPVVVSLPSKSDRELFRMFFLVVNQNFLALWEKPILMVSVSGPAALAV